MIITNVCLLLEALSVIICLHYLYGEKFRLDILTVSFLSVDMIVMTVINFLGLPKAYTMVIYPVIILYCGIKFGVQIKKMLINILVCIVLVGGIQWMVALPICYLLDIHYFTDKGLLAITIMAFFVLILILPFLELKKFTSFLRNKEKFLLFSIVACLVFVLFWLFNYKKIELIELGNTLILFICIVFILMLSVQLVKYKIKAKEVEIELKMHQVYSEPFQGLVEDIRLRQHEFDNHINAIYSQHFSCHTFEELVEAQKRYCEHITKDNRFNKLLAQDNSVIRGFLYARFVEIDRMGIDIGYRVVINDLNIGIPIYKLVEILGNLINNAVDVLVADKKRNKLYVSIVEADKFYIEVRNESPYIAYDTLGIFFLKGYSKKGENRGLGLYNVKRICDNYGLKIEAECIQIDGTSWLSFKVWREM